MSASTVDKTSAAFTRELARWRVDRGMTKKQLAARMGFDPSYLSHIEAQRHMPTATFAQRADVVLGAKGAIWKRFEEYAAARARAGLTSPTLLPSVGPAVAQQWLPPSAGLVIELEEAQLTYHDDAYTLVVRRALYNAGIDPVTRYPITVAVDRYPGQAARSNSHHRTHPLTLGELGLAAERGEPGTVTDPMRWRVRTDRDAFKEIWLLFENDDGRFPLYPGERTTVQYRYSVSELKWGMWFERVVRLPTRRLVMQMRFPALLRPQVWGVETSTAADEAPLRTPMQRYREDDYEVFTWRSEQPQLAARFRMQWRWRPAGTDTAVEVMTR